MKNIVILGVARSGKTTLARKIAHQFPDYHILNGDCLRASFQKVFPKLMMDKTKDNLMPENFSFFCSELLKHEIKENKNHFHYIFESCDVTPSDAKKYFDLENTVIYFLGYPRLTVEEIIYNYKSYAEDNDYMLRKTAQEIKERANRWLNKSKEFELQCMEHHINFVDVSTNRNQQFEKLIKEL